MSYGAHSEADPGRSNSPAVYIFASALATVFLRLTAEAGNVARPSPFISGVDHFVYRSERDRHLLGGRRCIDN